MRQTARATDVTGQSPIVPNSMQFACNDRRRLVEGPWREGADANPRTALLAGRAPRLAILKVEHPARVLRRQGARIVE